MITVVFVCWICGCGLLLCRSRRWRLCCCYYNL